MTQPLAPTYEPMPAGDALVTAPLGRRVAARAVDELVLAALTLPVVLIGAIKIGQGAYDDVRARVERNLEQGASTASAFDAVQTWRVVSGLGEKLVVLLVVFALIRALYTALTLKVMGGTPGKRALGLRVVPARQVADSKWRRPSLLSAFAVGATGPALLLLSVAMPLLLLVIPADWVASPLDRTQGRTLRERAARVRTVQVRGAALRTA